MILSDEKVFNFSVGYHQFHKKQLYNFQLNRWYSLGYLSNDNMKKAQSGI